LQGLKGVSTSPQRKVQHPGRFATTLESIRSDVEIGGAGQ
jgi:hypothetical protein